MANALPAVLHLKPEDVDTIEKRRIYTVGIVGCGLRGVLYAKAFAEAGYKVICVEADQSLVRRLSKGKLQFSSREAESQWRSFVRTGQLNATSEVSKAIAQSDIIIVTLTVKINEKKNPDYAEIENATRQVGAAIQRDSLVIYSGTAGFGFTEGLFKDILENTSGLKVGADFGLAYVPGQDVWREDVEFGEQELKVAAGDKTSLNCAAVIFETVAKKGVKLLADVKTAELATLFGAALQDANVALANELAVFCEEAGADCIEVQKLLGGDVGGVGFSATIAEEQNRSEAYLLLDNAEGLNVKLRVPALARQINEDVVRHAVGLTGDALREGGKTLRRARVALLGAALEDTGAGKFVEMLEEKGAKSTRYDPESSDGEQAENAGSVKRTLNETVEGADCLVVLSGQDQFRRLNLKKLRAIMKSPAALVDLAGVVEPAKVVEAGFVYRGLGRGVWKK